MLSQVAVGRAELRLDLREVGALDVAQRGELRPSGPETVQWPPYWLVQPLILALGVAVLHAGAWVRRRVVSRSVRLA